ncbi:MAG: hypothetical protein Q7W44_01685 [Coriobacteriia bacterium]|nr:hypothetical protein [Coriobacteriia bacterium]
MAKPFARTAGSGVAPKASKPMLSEHELTVLQRLSGIEGGMFGSLLEDIEAPARRLLWTLFERAVGGSEYEWLLRDWEPALIQAARIQRLCCDAHWGWLPLCMNDPFEGLTSQATPMECPLRDLCSMPDGFAF